MHHIQCSVNRPVNKKNTLMRTDLVFKPILLPRLGFSHCVTAHMWEKLCSTQPPRWISIIIAEGRWQSILVHYLPSAYGERVRLRRSPS